MYQYVQLRMVNVRGKATRETLSTVTARINLIWAWVNFGIGRGAGGAGGISDKVRMLSELQLRLWFKYGWGESVGSCCWLSRVSRRPFWEETKISDEIWKCSFDFNCLRWVSRHFTGRVGRQIKQLFKFLVWVRWRGWGKIRLWWRWITWKAINNHRIL